MAAEPPREPIFGYLSTLESADHGYFGGYLVVSLLGRPLEFHCTAPVRPSRAQRILYGPTLQPYLLGEQIGGTLLGEAQLCADLMLTDQRDAVFLRSQSNIPLVCFDGKTHDPQTPGQTDHVSGDDPASIASVPEGQVLAMEAPASADVPQQSCLFSKSRFSVGGCHWVLPHGFETDRQAVVELLTRLARHVDLAEPFGRIHEAIYEAQRIGGRSQDAHGQAA